ncbi:hypothetical protein FJZ36_08685 [Candidatus Poribacteria bacterium]|nr:hypothetical protein [Candidatus Poribacteria bacterium]
MTESKPFGGALGTVTRRLVWLLKKPLTWLVVVFAVVYGLTVVPYWKTTWDSATYIDIAESLLRGEGYSYNGYPHTKYPPGFPLLLAAVEIVADRNFLWMRALIVACAVTSIALTYALIRRCESSVVAIAVAAMTGACFAVVFEGTRILSDLPYMACSLGTLYIAERYGRDRRSSVLCALIALMVASYSVRIVGFVLAPAIALAPVLNPSQWRDRERRRDAVIVVATMGLVIAAWMGRNAVVTRHLPVGLRESLSYESELVAVAPDDPGSARIGTTHVVSRLRSNAVYYEGLIAGMLTGRRARGSAWMHGLAAVVVLGWLLSVIRSRSATDLYAGMYAVVFLLWPSPQGERFVVPVVPLMMYYALAPWLWLWNRAGRAMTRVPVGDLLAMGAAIAVVWLNARLVVPMIRAERRTPYYDQGTQNYLDSIAWVGDHTPADSVIITDRAPYAVLFGERRAFTSPWTADQSLVLRSIDENGGTHIIANNVGYSPRFLLPVIEAHPGRFREVHRIGENRILEVVTEPQP